MKAKIEISMDNAAFDENAGLELSQILRVASHAVIDGTKNMLKGFTLKLRDTNGNVVGQFKISAR